MEHISVKVLWLKEGLATQNNPPGQGEVGNTKQPSAGVKSPLHFAWGHSLPFVHLKGRRGKRGERGEGGEEWEGREGRRGKTGEGGRGGEEGEKGE